MGVVLLIDVEKIIYEALNCNEKYIIPWNKNAHNQYTKNIAIENFIINYCNNTDIKMYRYNNGAFYYPISDKIMIPPRCWFNSVTEYYRIVFHEMCHSTGNQSRDNRKYFDYDPFEELVAEIGAINLMIEFNIIDSFSYNNALAYCRGWIYNIICDNEHSKLLDLEHEVLRCNNFILNKGGQND